MNTLENTKKIPYDFCWIIKGNRVTLKGKKKYRKFLVNYYSGKNIQEFKQQLYLTVKL